MSTVKATAIVDGFVIEAGSHKMAFEPSVIGSLIEQLGDVKTALELQAKSKADRKKALEKVQAAAAKPVSTAPAKHTTHTMKVRSSRG